MTAKEELKELVGKMNAEQLEWFICQMQLVLSEGAAEPAPLKACQ